MPVNTRIIAYLVGNSESLLSFVATGILGGVHRSKISSGDLFLIPFDEGFFGLANHHLEKKAPPPTNQG